MTTVPTDYSQINAVGEDIKALKAEIERLLDTNQKHYDEGYAHGVSFAKQEAADEIERLRGALRDAREDVAHWGGYAPQWAQNKHDLAGDLARIDAANPAEETTE